MAFLTRGRAFVVGLVSLASGLVCMPAAGAQPEGTIESEVKAAFIYNFAKYVEWPPTAFPGDKADPLRICVLADAGFVGMIDSIIAGETIDGRKVVREIPESVESARSCHILFVGRADADRLRQLLSAVEGAAVLTVSDSPDFLSQGGTIAFIRDGSRLRFDVNQAAAQRNGLAVSSRLLRVARRVQPSSPKD